MKIRLSLFCIALALIAANVADAQGVGPLEGAGYAQSGFQNVRGDLLHTSGLPGRLWFEATGAGNGLGRQGSYGSLGFKTRLGEDRLDGRWLLESRSHLTFVEDGDFFLNIGIERVFSIVPANADISMSLWYDYNSKDQNNFTHNFHQVGVTTQLKKEHWDFILNGYIPVGVQNYTYGDLTGANPFVGNNIVMTPGIDSALQGFDATLRLRPRQFSLVNGFVDVGGYHYNSDLVNAFSGVKVRTGFQLLQGAMVTVELNNDERFNTTALASVGWMFGANASGHGHEYSGLGRDLEQTTRNDNIVRFNRDIVLAIDPDTGAAYNVIHADNTADAALGAGTAELPFATLAEAEAASSPQDIIYVHGGDGTDRNYRDGITLQDDQFLLSGGGTQFIPVQNGLMFGIPPSSPVATISNSGGNAVVTLADNNVVGGINIDAAGANYGIFGAGGNEDGEIRQSSISGSTLDGIGLVAAQGDWDFTGNRISQSGRHGINVDGNPDITSIWNFENNIIESSTFDGINMQNYDGISLTATRNTTSDNGRHGMFLNQFLNGDGTGIDIDILGHTSANNGGDGVVVNDGDGNLRFLNGLMTGNTGAGLRIADWTDTLGSDRTLIGASTGSTSVFSNNGTGIALELEQAGLVQDVLVTSANVTGNGRGLFADVEGIGTVMNLDIVNNTGFNNNSTEGIRLQVDNSGVINNLITNTTGQLSLTNNNITAGGTITYVLGGANGQPNSEINSIVRNVNINTAAGTNKIGIQVEGVENSRIDLDVADSSITGAGAIDIELDNDGQNLLNETHFDNLVLRGDGVVTGNSETGTFWDFSLTNSNLQSNGILAGAGETLDRTNPAAYTPYTDILGAYGILITANGAIDGGGIFDNFSRIRIQNNVVRDFTFDGISIFSTGDAQVLTYVESNQVFNNGPGLDDDPDGDGIFEGPNSPAVVPTEFFFHDGLNIAAFDQSTLSARINNNTFTDNFERGISLQTFGTSMLYVDMNDNFLSNDIGDDNTPSPPGPIGSDIFDMDVINSDGSLIRVDLSNNSFRLLPVNFVQLGAPADPQSDFRVGLDGASNGFTDADLPGFVGAGGYGLADILITAEEMLFQVNGFPPITP